MNIALTWANYALITAVCLGFYYSVVGLLIYRNKNRLIFPDKPDANTRSNSTIRVANKETTDKNLFGEPVSEYRTVHSDELNFNPEAQDFADEIVAFTSSCDEAITKAELIESIKRIIRKYPSQNNSESRYDLNQLIAISTENYCSTHISAEELNELWRS